MDQNLYYVYIHRSRADPNRHYTGFSEAPLLRFKDHNFGKCPHSKKHRPWMINYLLGFSDMEKDLEFERYLKSPSGRAFARERF